MKTQRERQRQRETETERDRERERAVSGSFHTPSWYMLWFIFVDQTLDRTGAQTEVKLEFSPPLLNLMSPREHCQRVRWMKQAMRKAVCDGIGWKTQQAGIRSLKSEPRLYIPSLGSWGASCPLWSRPAHPLTLEPSGQMLLCSQEMNAPFSFTWGRKAEYIRPTLQSFQP